MPNIYFDKLKCDDGGTPSIRDGVLSLAICKPLIRSTATRHDVIFGFAANSLHSDNRLIYIAEVTDKEENGTYYRGHSFAMRPDCIYRWRMDHLALRAGARYHRHKSKLEHAAGTYPGYKRATVLLSDDFCYFGGDGNDAYKANYPEIARAIMALGQGHRVQHRKQLRNELFRLKRQTWESENEKIIGRATTRAPDPYACHRERWCGVWRDGFFVPAG